MAPEPTTPEPARPRRDPDPAALSGLPVVVAGAGTAGRSAARFLLDAGAQVTLADARFDETGDAGTGRTGDGVLDDLVALGARPVAIATLLDDDSWTSDTALLITSPGFAPGHPLLVQTAAAGIPVWGEVELAWRVDRAGLFGVPRTWLVVTGTNGKTTTTSMLAGIVAGSGRAAAACGNIGLPVLDAMAQTPRVDVLCIELSSFQLHWAPSVVPDAGVVLNVAEDHLDWHGSFDAYAQAKTGALRGAIGIVGLDDPVAAHLPVAGRRIGFTLGAPAAGQLGVDGTDLVDRAFGPGDDEHRQARVLVAADDVTPPGPSGRADALAASALALAVGVSPAEVGAGLRAFRPGAHRGDVVARVDGIDYIDDSKATNPHAAQAAIRGHRRVVLLAGGLLKGAEVDDLITGTRDRLAGVVAIGRDREQIVDAIARHAPEVPTVSVFTGDDGRVTILGASAVQETADEIVDREAGDAAAVAVLDRAVREAAALARAAADTPDAVLLAPAAASLDMFAGYGRRGDVFAAAARALPGAEIPGAGGTAQ